MRALGWVCNACLAVGLACSAAQAADPLRAREAALGLPYGEPSLATDTQAAQAEPAKAPDPVAARAASAPAAAVPKAKPAAPRRAVAAQPDPDEEARLKAIREALVLAAAKGPTRVVADAWLDGNGALREDTRMTSEVRVRGVRVRSYLEGDAQRRWQAEVDATDVDPRLTPEALAKRRACPVPEDNRWVHHVDWRITRQAAPASVWDYFADQAQAAAQRPWQQAAGLRWVATSAAPQPASAYQRALLGQEGPVAPWQLHMTIAAAQGAGQSVDITLQARLVHSAEQSVAWQDQVRVNWPLQAQDLTTPALPSAVASALQQAAQRWQQALSERLACEPLHFALHREAGSLTLHVGQPSGLRLGDRVVLVNKRDIPAQVLHAGVASRMALAKVEAIDGQRSVLKQVAGPTLPAQGDWVALPL
ncbi:MAG: hypothetical protein RLZ34_1226 [Pseudomonadota bacterium]